MSKQQPKKKSIYTNRNLYQEEVQQEKVYSFPELHVKILTIDTAMLLLSSQEDAVLITVFQHIVNFSRKPPDNIKYLQEKLMLDLLQSKEFFISKDNVIVKRFALYLTTVLIENLDTLKDLTTERVKQILDICLIYYVAVDDDFCIEYLSVIINKCLDDPQVAHDILSQLEYLNKSFTVLSKTDNPDVVLHSIQALYKMLQVQSMQEMQKFIADKTFPTDRITCELTNEFMEVRSAALKVIKTLMPDTSEASAFSNTRKAVNVLEQLTQLFCDLTKQESSPEAVEVLAVAMRSEKCAQLFFEHNLFDKTVQHMSAHPEDYPLDTKCHVLAIFAESAKYVKYLFRLHVAHITELFLECLLRSESFGPATHILTGLNRLMKLSEAANSIMEAYQAGVIGKLLNIIGNPLANMKTREQAAELIANLLVSGYHNTVDDLLRLGITDVLGNIFHEGFEQLSIDFVLTLLGIIESLAQNQEYRQIVGDASALIANLALLLKDSFAAAMLTSNIFRCLCTLVDEDSVRPVLLEKYIIASTTRGLKSSSNVVKTAVTNFIMQTTRFPEFLQKYIDVCGGVLEVLILRQKYAFCVTTWAPAIESILSKTPTLKFAIRNQLNFTDITCQSGADFLVSKKKFEDYRCFQSIIGEEVSPLDPILVVNFSRLETTSIITIPMDCLMADGVTDPSGWCYCKHPGDPFLPDLLDELNKELERHDLVENPEKMRRCIDFDNVARRAKVIAILVARIMSEGLNSLDLNADEECSEHAVRCFMKGLTKILHCNFLPLGMIRTGCQFERAILFKVLADQIGLPCTLQRSVDGRILFNELPLPVEIDHDVHCQKNTMQFMSWRMLRPTHVVDLICNVGELYPTQSRQALQYLRLF